MPINDQYIVPESVVTYLQNGTRSFNALRLTHGILYWVIKWLGEDNLHLADYRLSTERIIRCRDISDAVGPVGATDNDWLHAAVQQLKGQGLFQSIRIEGQRLHFVASPSFRAAFPRSRPTKKNPLEFAKMRTDQVRSCRTLHDILFLTLASLHGGKRYPKLYLPRLPEDSDPRREPKHRIDLDNLDRGEVAWRRPWQDTSKSWISAAVRVGAVLGHAYLIAPKRGIFDDRVSEVAVKIQHGNTEWSAGKLYIFSAGTRDVVQITMSGRKTTLNQKAVRARHHQTVIA